MRSEREHVDAELAKLATLSCGFAGAKNCTKPPLPFENRFLCEEHIAYVKDQRTSIQRRYASLDSLERMFQAADAEQLRAR